MKQIKTHQRPIWKSTSKADKGHWKQTPTWDIRVLSSWADQAKSRVLAVSFQCKLVRVRVKHTRQIHQSVVTRMQQRLQAAPKICVAFFKNHGGFPGGSVVKNPPTSVGDTGSIPGPGRFHMLQSNWTHASPLLSLCSGAREPQLLKPSRNKRSHWNEKPAHCN